MEQHVIEHVSFKVEVVGGTGVVGEAYLHVNKRGRHWTATADLNMIGGSIRDYMAMGCDQSLNRAFGTAEQALVAAAKHAVFLANQRSLRLNGPWKQEYAQVAVYVDGLPKKIMKDGYEQVERVEEPKISVSLPLSEGIFHPQKLKVHTSAEAALSKFKGK